MTQDSEGSRQDDCEQVMSEIESILKEIGYTLVAKAPPGAKTFGARKAIVFSLAGLGAGLIVIGLVLR